MLVFIHNDQASLNSCAWTEGNSFVWGMPLPVSHRSEVLEAWLRPCQQRTFTQDFTHPGLPPFPIAIITYYPLDASLEQADECLPLPPFECSCFLVVANRLIAIEDTANIIKGPASGRPQELKCSQLHFI